MSDTTSRRPQHFRIDVNFRSNPKIGELAAMGNTGWQAIVMWMDSLAYATQHLTDGYIPPHWPRANGYSRPATDKLIQVELWHPAIRLAFDGINPPPPQGWLINGYAAYQVSRAGWTEEGRRRHEASMKAHQARWPGTEGRSNGHKP